MNIDDEALAKKRFFVLGAVRLSGAVMIAFGLAVLSNGLLDLPRVVGFALLAFGIFDFIMVPVLLARQWKSPPNS